jgi:hypothetical protein
MNIRRIAAVTVTVTGAAAVTVAATFASATTRPGTHHTSVSAAARPAVAGGAGWQGDYTYDVAAGLTGLYFHYSCPTGMVASNGGYSASDLAGKIRVTTDSPRWNSGDNQWQWAFDWPGGAPSGDTIDFDVYCTAGPA